MPELPEVEVLVRRLDPLLRGRRIESVTVHRDKTIRPLRPDEFGRQLLGAKFGDLERRAKYLVFTLERPGKGEPLVLLGHLGMTGRMYLLPVGAKLPRHAAVVFGLGKHRFVFEDTRYFGRLTLDASPLSRLGPEPLGSSFKAVTLATALARSRQPIKVRLLDQTAVAGLGNIYASEALFQAGINPRRASAKLTGAQVKALWKAMRRVLRQAINLGSTVPLNFGAKPRRDGLFYFGRLPGTPDYYEERLLVYDRAGKICPRCTASSIRRITQAGRSTFFCPKCQR